MRALVYGAVNPDIVHELPRLPQPGDDLRSRSWHITWGGKAANVAAALATWGVDVRLCGLMLGTDPLGDALIDALRGPGVDVDWLVRDPSEPTRHCVILFAPDGERTIVCTGYEGAVWQEVPEDAWEDVDVVVLDGLSGAAAAVVAAEALRRNITTVWLDAPDPPPVPVDLVVWSRHEHGPTRAAELGQDGQDIALTAGPDPVVAWVAGTKLSITPPPVLARNTTGAGDAFAAGAAYALCRGDGLEDALLWAVAAGATVAARGRDDLPGMPAVRALRDAALRI